MATQRLKAVAARGQIVSYVHPMRSRTENMWWGTAIEAPDPGALARFYSELLGWQIGHEEPGTAILVAPPGGTYIVFQQADGLRAAGVAARRGAAAHDDALRLPGG